MAGRVDILLKMVGDARDAVGAFDKTTQAAKRTETQTQQTQQSIQRMLRSISVGTAISALGSIESALSTVADIVNGLTGGAGRQAAADQALAQAASPAQLGAAVAAKARANALAATPGKIWQNIVPGRPASETPTGRRVSELQKLLLAMSPEEARAALSGVPSEFFSDDQLAGYTRGDVARAITGAERGRAYQTGLRGGTTTRQGNVTTNIVYPMGTNPTSVDRNMSRYERVNGRPRRP